MVCRTLRHMSHASGGGPKSRPVGWIRRNRRYVVFGLGLFAILVGPGIWLTPDQFDSWVLGAQTFGVLFALAFAASQVWAAAQQVQIGVEQLRQGAEQISHGAQQVAQGAKNVRDRCL
jgi:X-X-X-Leu-X-X-Gly heptad repeat protein